MHNNIIDISSSQYGFNNFFNSTGFLILRVKLQKVVIRGKICCFFLLWALLLKMYILEVVAFFLAQWLSNQLNVSVVAHIYKIHVTDEAFLLLTIGMPMITKHFRVVTCCKELSPIYLHDISTESSFGVTEQMKYISLSAEDVSIPYQGTNLV